MAAAVVPNWSQQPRGGGGGGGGGFMALSNTNNRNPNPNPKSKFQQAQAQARDHRHQHQNQHDADFNDDEVTQTASDDASSINHHRRSVGFNKYVSFNVATYSRKEVAELKSRLLSELDQIRLLKNRIEAAAAGNKKRPFDPAEDAAAARNKDLMKNCAQILSKVMKNKYAWIFSKPVDVVALKLHDYYDIIKRPMDLGTVKTNLTKNLYSSPMEFASDVRLTFENAMRYNPKGHEVYSFADQLRSRFEELFQPLVDKMAADEEELQATSWNRAALVVVDPQLSPIPMIPIPPHSSIPIPPHSSMRVEKKKKKNKTEPPHPHPPAPAPAPLPLPQSQTSSQLKGKPLKQPKPKARDPNKRDMSMEEKHKLGIGLQSLPQEKMDQVVQIIKKRNGHLKQDGDEIELDIEAVDTETLWELDRLVTNWNKMVSKIKRQALMGNNSNSNIASNRESQEEMPAGHVAATEPKRPKKGEVGDEDVDIGDDMPMSSFPPVEIEKDVGGNASADNSSSSSGSSTSGSSSSSDSDSGSSSGSDSDNDNAQS